VLSALSANLPVVPGEEYGPAVFPILIATGLATCGALLIFSSARTKAPLIAFAPWARRPRQVAILAATLAGVAFYLVASEKLGFVLTIMLVLIVLFRLLSVHWALSLILSAIVTSTIYLSFVLLLRVPLPPGSLPPFRW
jgi:putative tricarboxylic transport membrane protein